jgi:type IV pilus assembly protein PilA
MKEKDQGFTLIELLVVIVIIGVLASIAIPLFLNQRKKGVDASLQSDLKSAATNVEMWVVDNPSLAVPDETVKGVDATGTATTTPVVLATFKASKGNTVSVVPSATQGAYCIFGFNAGASAAVSATALMAYTSLGGGIQPGIATGQTCA